MGRDNESLIGAATSRYVRARGLLTRVSTIFNQLAFSLPQGARNETIAQLAERWKLDERQRQFLIGLCGDKAGATFFDEKIRELNRGALHRSAFVLNAATQLLFVDLGAQLYLSLPQIKWVFVAANLALAGFAHLAIRQQVRALLSGPNALPSKRRLGGLLRNPRYNKAVKKSSLPYARSAWREKTLYRSAYFINAATIFVGSQFIIPPERLIFPLGLIIGKATGLLSTVVMVFDLWRGVRAGEDARAAREKEVSVYGHLDI